ncbi:PilZ domain-containing protein [bacterium]|nr:PilZ domain-containing protein [bacterium]
MNSKYAALFGAGNDVEFDPLPVGIKRQLAEQLAKPIVSSTSMENTRKHSRRPFNQLALAVRITDDDTPNGQIFQVFVKDISSGGIGFIHTRAFNNERIAVKLTGMGGGTIVVIGRAVRCICRQRWYEIGLDFKSHRVLTPANAAIPHTDDAPTESSGTATGNPEQNESPAAPQVASV